MTAGRPPKPIDWKVFEQLCHIQCTHSEIASFFNIVVDTLYDRAEAEYGEKFSSTYKRFAEGGKSSLRRSQFRMADKSCAMAIWLGKQYLGQKDHEETPTAPPNDTQIIVAHENMVLKAKVAELEAKVANLPQAG